MSDDEKGFVIKDRRLFSQDGKIDSDETEKAEPKQEEQEPAAEAEVEEPKKPQAAPETETDQQEQPVLPPITFSTFVFSLGSSVLMHLGEIPDPVTNQPVTNLPLAKQTIDILGMLEEKTMGNLDEEEGQLLTSLLYELRMKFVTATS